MYGVVRGGVGPLSGSLDVAGSSVGVCGVEGVVPARSVFRSRRMLCRRLVLTSLANLSKGRMEASECMNE